MNRCVKYYEPCWATLFVWSHCFVICIVHYELIWWVQIVACFFQTYLLQFDPLSLRISLENHLHRIFLLHNPQSILIIQYYIRLTYPYDVRITLKITENAYRLHIMFYKTPNLTQRYFISNGMFKEQTQRNYDCTSCLCYIENYIILLRKERKTNLKCSAALRFFAIIFGFFFALAFK